jgi:nitrite reductase/ring-hydroxylating ferredoxin subunit
MDERFERLEQWTRDHYPSFTRSDYRWSGQVLETIDFMPFLRPARRHQAHLRPHRRQRHGADQRRGRQPHHRALILGEHSRFAPVLDPSRKSFGALSSVEEFIREQAGSAKNMLEHITPSEISSADELAPGEGGLMRRGLKKVAVYKGEDGQVIERSALCTHLGCIVHWNGFEKCWDCPCHGSQFAPDGQVLNGPAVTPLAEVGE